MQHKIKEGYWAAPALLPTRANRQLPRLRNWLFHLGVLLCCLAVRQQAYGQTWQGALALGDRNLGSVVVQGSALDAAGNSYLIGSTLDDVSLGPDTLKGVGPQAYFLAKLDASGQWLWAQRLPASPRAIALNAAGDLYLTGSFQGTAVFGPATLTSATSYYPDAFVGKLTPTGTWLWAQAVGGSEIDQGTALAVDATGNAYLAGDFRSPTLSIGLTTLTNASGPSSVPDIFLAKLDPAGNWQWAKQLGGAGADWVNGVALDASGGVYLAGGFNGATSTFGTTTLTNAGGTTLTSDGFLAKFTAAGAAGWLKQIGGPGNEGGSAVALDASGNIYLTGSFTSPTLPFGSTTLTVAQPTVSNVYVAKLTPAGTWDWAQQTTSATGASSGSTKLVVTAAGSAFVLGQFSAANLQVGQQVLTNAQPAGSVLTNDGFVAKLTPAGAWEWAQAVGGTEEETASGLNLTATGDVVLAGTFESSPATFGPTTLHAVRASAFVGRLQSSGTWRWVSKQADRGVAAFAAVAADAAGNAYVTGNFRGTLTAGSTTLTTTGSQDILVGKLSSTGQWLWAARAGGTSVDRATALAVDAGGNVYVTGLFTGTARFGTALLTSTGATDIFVAKLSASGTWLWATQAGGAAEDGGAAVALDASGQAYVTGWLTGTAALGATTLATPLGAATRYPFAAKLTGAGGWQWAQALGDQGQGNGLAVGLGGEAYVTGRAANQVFVTKLDPTGTVSWRQAAGGTPFEDQGTAIGVDASGSVYVAGGFKSPSIVLGSTTLLNSNVPSGYNYTGVNELFVAKLTAAGTWLWATKASGAGAASALALDSQGNVLLTGALAGSTATFGAATLTGNAFGDVFVGRLTTAGGWQWAQKVNGISTPGGLAIGAAGRVYVAGLFDGVVPFGSVTLAGGGYFRSSFLAWLADSNSPLASTPAVAAAAFALYPTIVQDNRVYYAFTGLGSLPAVLDVYTLTGQHVARQPNASSGSFVTAGWQSGWYVARLTTASGQYVARFYQP